MKSIRIMVTISLAMLLLFGASCAKQQKPETVNLAAFQLYVSGLVVAAEQSNEIVPEVKCFDKAGLNCDIIKMAKGPDVVGCLVGGSADFGTLANTPVVLQAMQGSNLSIFATIQTTDHDIKVVGRRSSGITSGESLTGKRIGFVGGTIGEIFLDRYLVKHGIEKTAVTLTSGGPAQLRDLFFNKSLDAIIIWEPIIQDILRDASINKEDVFIDVDPTLYVLRMHLVAKPEILKEKREEAQKLVEAIICGESILKKHPEGVQKQLELWLDRKPGTLENVFEESTFRVELNVPVLLKELREEAEWAQTSVFSGKGTIPENFEIYVDPSILESVDPERITK